MFRVYNGKNVHLGKLSHASDALTVAENHTGSTIKVGPRKGRVVVWTFGDPLDHEAVVKAAEKALGPGETGDDHIAGARTDGDDAAGEDD